MWALWRTRRSTPLFDLGVWLLSLALLASAVRGLMFFGIVSVAVCQRCVLRARASGVSLLPAIGAGSARILRVLGISFTVMLAGAAVTFRWIKPSVALAGTQPGLGRAVGGWAEAATDFLRAQPAAGSHAEPRRRAGRRRHLLDPGRARVRRFAPGIVPAGLPARGAGRRDRRRRAGQADPALRRFVGVRRPHAARAARSAAGSAARRVAAGLRRQRAPGRGAAGAGDRGLPAPARDRSGARPACRSGGRRRRRCASSRARTSRPSCRPSNRPRAR